MLEEMNMMNLGRRFKPSDDFLIKVLQLLSAGRRFDLSATTEFPGDLTRIDLYGPGKEPWRIFSGDDEIWELNDETDSEMRIRKKYVVSKISKFGKKSVSRTAGAGCWLDRSKTTDVMIDGQVKGHQKTLTYEYCGDDAEVQGKCHYYLHELRLSQDALQEVGVSSSDYVICKVLKNLSKGCLIKRGKKRREQEANCSEQVSKRCRNTTTSNVEVVKVDELQGNGAVEEAPCLEEWTDADVGELEEMLNPIGSDASAIDLREQVSKRCRNTTTSDVEVVKVAPEVVVLDDELQGNGAVEEAPCLEEWTDADVGELEGMLNPIGSDASAIDLSGLEAFTIDLSFLSGIEAF